MPGQVAITVDMGYGRHRLSGSKIPPRTLAKIKRLSPRSEARRIYVQELIGRYEIQSKRIPRKAKSIADSWAKPQQRHLLAVIEELREFLR